MKSHSERLKLKVQRSSSTQTVRVFQTWHITNTQETNIIYTIWRFCNFKDVIMIIFRFVFQVELPLECPLLQSIRTTCKVVWLKGIFLPCLQHPRLWKSIRSDWDSWLSLTAKPSGSCFTRSRSDLHGNYNLNKLIHWIVFQHTRKTARWFSKIDQIREINFYLKIYQDCEKQMIFIFAKINKN